MSGPVLVTGASRGIGRAVARLLVQLGHDVVGVYRSREDEARSLTAVAGERLRMVRADLGVAQEVEELVTDGLIGTEPLAGVVLSAGISHRGPFDAKVTAWGGDPLVEELRVNLEAPLRLLRALLREGALGKGAGVVVLGSNLARRGCRARWCMRRARPGSRARCAAWRASSGREASASTRCRRACCAPT